MKHLVGIDALSNEEMREILALTAKMKADPRAYRTRLAGKSLAMLFQKPSTRTRMSFQVGIFQLGGQALVMGQNDLQLGRGETLADTAKVMSRYVHGLMARVFGHDDVVELAKHATIPVINGLSDMLHPCQGLTDYFSMQECFGDLSGLRVAYLGDGNNVAHSLAHGAARLGVHLVIGTPGGRYSPSEDVIAAAREHGKSTGATIDVVTDASEAVKGARVVYTDVWTSMGQEAENAQRLQDLRDFQVDGALFGKAEADAIFMHCLPAHRGEEVADDVADHKRSIIFDQAENRLHTQKALMALLM